MSNRTIAAISTPLGEGATGTVRISGENAFQIADSIFISASGKKIADIKGYTALYGEIFSCGERLDDAVALKFCAPKSYTGENVVEITVHGGKLILRETLRAVLSAGATLAEPGEFTKRAYLNGKLDFTRAESIMSMISARSRSALRMAGNAAIGRVAEKIEHIEELLLSAASAIAVYSDYPEEGLEELSEDEFKSRIASAKNALAMLLKDYDTGRLITVGVDTVIVGRPNVGKSTLMNFLSGANRSIVTDIAGTTRDVIEDTVILGDIPLRLADTAGICTTSDTVEAVGIEKAKLRIKNCDFILAVFDTSLAPSADDKALLELIGTKPCLAVLNKSDIKEYNYQNILGNIPFVYISAKHSLGKDALVDAVSRIVGTADFDPDSAVLMNERQRSKALAAYNAASEAYSALESGVTLDAVGVCLDDALAALSELTGKRVTSAVADEIFKNFCVGK